MDALTVERLTLAWMRRRQWENKTLALEIVGLLGQAMGGNTKRDGAAAGRIARSGAARIPASEMLQMMGLKL